MLECQDGTRTRIVEVNFTFALPGGLWLKDEHGMIDWVSDNCGPSIYGKGTWDYWHKAAYHDGWCGLWYKV